MKIADFPKTIGRLTRRNAEKSEEGFSGLVYTMDQRIAKAKKFTTLRGMRFVVREGEESRYNILIDGDHFADANDVPEVISKLMDAFDHEGIRAGIDKTALQPHAPSDMESFKNPRHAGKFPVLKRPGSGDEVEVFNKPKRVNTPAALKRPPVE